MLKKYLEDYVNGPEAKTYASFKSGAVLKDEEFGSQKRFPKGESEKSFPPVRCIKMPATDLMKENIPDEKIKIEDKENIV